MMLPDAIAATLSRSLKASASLAAYLASAPNVPRASREAAQRDLADAVEALAWLAEQEGVRRPRVIHHARRVVDEGLRWPRQVTAAIAGERDGDV